MPILVLEGPDGCGKTSTAQLIAERHKGTYLRCPGGTRMGELLRGPLKDPTFELGEEAMTLAFAAVDIDCMRLAEKRSAEGEFIVMDRCGISNLVYRRAMGQEKGEKIILDLGFPMLMPSRGYVYSAYLSVGTAELDRRLSARKAEGTDRFDALGQKVRDEYANLAFGVTDNYEFFDGIISIASSWSVGDAAQAVMSAFEKNAP